ncbi:PREDICTED: uncharacterized protein LOC109326335 [Lupinus angustifolius]|uniref:uncharacterized protein LOC109326335 n=1 Tax=Lupinus angustifolius TaxID=3871 RepID=UPI00092E84A7|nr:PREDICTED: uncharacterized protein LOC109326335 [Lupinus angustifolius]
MRKVAHVLKTDLPVVSDEAEKEKKDKLAIDIALSNETDFLCKNFILNGLSSDHYDYYSLYKIADEIVSESMPLDKQFQVAVIIDKLPPGWKDFKNLVKHKTEEFSLESLITHLCIKKEARRQDHRDESGYMAHKYINNLMDRSPHTNMIDEPFVIVLPKVNLVGGSNGWCIDTDTSRHDYYDRTMFKIYTDADDKKMLLGDSHTTIVARTSDVELMFTYG